LKKKIAICHLTSNNSTIIDAFLFLWFSQAIFAAVWGSRSSAGALRYGLLLTYKNIHDRKIPGFIGVKVVVLHANYSLLRIGRPIGRKRRR